mmetsp:Transcript_3768/g.504  ORF Transcript_3768/g.504 Transcript_3768/m.504 type:complete len:86 (-) Transcript_3768:174-431(-)
MLQFVICRPVTSVIALIAYHFQMYSEHNYGLDNFYIYLFVINNISYTLALYGLTLFYISTSELLLPFNPLPKFLCIKGVVFFSFW